MALQEQEPEALNNRNRILYPALIIIVVLILIAATSSMRRGAMPIFAAPANRDTITSSISTNGKIEPLNGFEAHAPAPASVKKLFVKEGDAVKPGQMLVQLDDAQAQADAARALALLRSAQADFNAVQNGGTREEVFTNQAQLNQAKAELQAAERNLQAVQKLQQSGAASPAEVQGAEARLKNAQSQVNLLQQKTTDRYSSPERQRAEAALEQAKSAYSAAQDVLAKSNVRSPIAGTVYSLPVRTGTFVNGGDLLVQVANLTNVTVRAFVDEPDIGRLAKGEKVLISWDALPGRTWEGEVTQIPATVTVRGSRTVGELTTSVDNSDRKLLPNVNVNVTIVTAKHENTMTVPREAVHQENGRRYVLQVVNDHLARRDVETGISNLTRIEITGGITEGAQVALASLNGQSLRDGIAVKVQQH